MPGLGGRIGGNCSPSCRPLLLATTQVLNFQGRSASGLSPPAFATHRATVDVGLQTRSATQAGELPPPTFAPKPAIPPLKTPKGATKTSRPPPWKTPAPPPPLTNSLGKLHKAQPSPNQPPKNEPISTKCPTPTGEAKNPTITNAIRERSDRTKRKRAKRATEPKASAAPRTKSKPSAAPAPRTATSPREVAR